MSNEIDPFQGLTEETQTKTPEKRNRKRAKKDVSNETIDHALMQIVKTKDKPTQKGDKGSAKDRANLIYKLNTYKKNKRLGPKLRDSGFNLSESHYNSLSVDDLKLEVAKYDMELSRNGAHDIVDHGLKFGLKVGENIVSKRTPLKVEGTCDELFNNDHFLDLLERVKLKYNLGIATQMDPLLELSLVIFQTGLMVHGKNKFKDQIKTDIDLNQEYNDEEEGTTKNN